MRTRSWWIGSAALAALALVCGSLARPQAARAAADYRAQADAGMAALQGWYNSGSGLWDSTGWWNSANVLEVTIDYSARTGSTAYRGDISNTFDKNKGGNFLNEYYDDEGWWALAWIKAYDLTGDTRYLDMAKTIFADMTGGWDSTCGGGIWWSKARSNKNAIPNELFLTVAARLHQRTPGDSGSGSYLDWANREWSWFNGSGMINAQNLVNDGLTSGCQNNGQTAWSYNQGVILGGLVEMYKITGSASYLSKAEAIADAAIAALSNANGVLLEPCEPNCGADGPQFKGIFVRNLYYLYQTDQRASYRDFITRNADSIWNNARNGSNQFGLRWAGPFDSADAARQSSAMDTFNAAIAFGTSSGTNLALNKSASGSTACASNEGAANAFDGSAGTKWCSGGAGGQNLQVDLGAAASIAKVVIKHAGAGGENTAWNTRDFNIQASADGSNWTTVASVTGNTSSVTTHTFGATLARYVRLNVVTAQTDTSYQAARIYELEVYGSGANLALNKSTSANGSCASSEVSSKAVDGSASTKWCAGATNGAYWLRVDLGASTSVGRVVVKHAGAGGENTAWNTRDFSIQVSGDGSNWTTVASATGNTSSVTTHTFSSVAARYVRLYITNPQTDPNFTAARIYELEVYGP